MANTLSPAPSVAIPHYAASDTLPVPRSKPIPSDSAKMTSLINFLDQRVLKLTGRYAKSFATEEWDDRPDAGYTNFEQILADIDTLIDVVWVSATLSIRLSYLLALAGYFRGYMHSFRFEGKAFIMARKFDQAFSMLLQEDLDQISTTDKVRIRSLAEETRYEVVELAARDGWTAEQSSDSDNDFEDFGPAVSTNPIEGPQENNEQDRTDGLGKIYEKTLMILGGTLTSLTNSSPEQLEHVKSSTPPYMDDVESFEL